MADKQMVTNGVHNFALKGGGLAIVRAGQPVPDNLEEGQLEHKRQAGAFDEPRRQDWAAMAHAGIVPAPENAEKRAEAAEQMVEAQTAPDEKADLSK